MGMFAGLCNQSCFSFNHFRKLCNYPNLCAAVEIRGLRKEYLPGSRDLHLVIDSFRCASSRKNLSPTWVELLPNWVQNRVL